MKKTIFTLCTLFIAAIVMAQVPDVMNYQAVARNNSGQALANQTIKVRLSVMKNAVQQYSETRQVITNALGLFNVQIGSAGAITTTGSFSGINWQSNAAPGYVLKVELDVNNSGTFTDMGSQSLITVPYAFATKKADQATETVNLAGRPLNTTATPAVGSKLMWDGSTWSPVRDTTIFVDDQSGATIQNGGGGAPWVFTNPGTTITVNGNEVVSGVLRNGCIIASGLETIVSAELCYQLLPNGPITPFVGTADYNDYSIHDRSLIIVSGAVKLPAGTYKIGMAIKNKLPSNVSNPIIMKLATGFLQIKQ